MAEEALAAVGAVEEDDVVEAVEGVPDEVRRMINALQHQTQTYSINPMAKQER